MFCQAKSAFFQVNESKGIPITPEMGTNMINLDNSCNRVGSSMWIFEDSQDSERQYIAMFTSVDTSKNTESFTLAHTGTLYHIYKNSHDLDLDDMKVTEKNKTATMILAGNNGICSLVVGLVCFN